MGLGDRACRPSAGARRAGYCVAIAFSAALLIILNGSPGWQAIPSSPALRTRCCGW